MDVISILRKQHQQVTGYVVNVRGERAQMPPKVFTTITVEHVVTGHHLDPVGVARAVELSETRYRGAGAMLRRTATLTHSIHVREAEEAHTAV
jgi:putative redox protein